MEISPRLKNEKADWRKKILNFTIIESFMRKKSFESESFLNWNFIERIHIQLLRIETATETEKL